MTTNKDQPSHSTLPEDIEARAGLPRSGDVEHSLHEIRDEILGKSGAAQPDTARDAYDDVRGTAEAAARQASDRASGLADRAAAATDEARGRVRDAYDDARERASGAYDDARSWAFERYDAQRRRASHLADRGQERYRQGRAVTEDFVSENPLIVGILGLAAGLLLGALLPRTQREDEALGPWADEARDHGLRYAREATLQGRRFVERALDPDNLDAAVQRGAAGQERPEQPEHQGQRDRREHYEGSERTAHRL